MSVCPEHAFLQEPLLPLVLLPVAHPQQIDETKEPSCHYDGLKPLKTLGVCVCSCVCVCVRVSHVKASLPPVGTHAAAAGEPHDHRFKQEIALGSLSGMLGPGNDSTADVDLGFLFILHVCEVQLGGVPGHPQILSGS